MLIRKFISSSNHLFSLDKKITQTDDEFNSTLLYTINHLLTHFYYLYQRLFIELRFSSFRSIVDYFHGVEFHPCFECFDWLLQIPNLMSGLPVDEKQQVNLNKEHILYVSLKKFYYENRAKMSKRIRDYELVEKNGYDKVIAVYELVKQKQLANSTSSPSYMDITAYEFTLCFDQFSSWPLFYAVISRIYKELNKWCKQANSVMVRKLFLDIEKKAIVFKLITFGFVKCNDQIKTVLTDALAKHHEFLETMRHYPITNQQTALQPYKIIQERASNLFSLLAKKQQQYADPAATETFNKAMGNLAQLTDSASLIKKIQQLQGLNDSENNTKVIKDYFASIQDPTLANLLSALWGLLAKENLKEQRVFDELQHIFKNPYDHYHTRLPSLYSFQLVNKPALMKDHTEKGKRT